METTSWPRADEWVVWYTGILGWHNSTQRDAILSSAATWVEPEGVVLSERIQAQKGSVTWPHSDVEPKE